ncbi:hypothetical protein N7478_012823 [Penicillium angulare]|uniref:uncharacterized protein n=1 Tax=Penicillium angulare TaxID=116970 RepID=UPI0025410597|nr:uncharacterized protein N7478_012823 [Penicillium angulare]KAJ5256719.1 hypothetical protein N7478_012823 [Penicillium angulare]
MSFRLSFPKPSPLFSVLSHGDLKAMNVLVNPRSGNITRVVDWAESRILPFGFALYGLESFLGRMNSEGWHYYDRYRELESLFWQTFREEAQNFSGADLHLVRVVRMAGFFYRYGLDFDTNGVVQGMRMNQPDGSLAYLDTFCAANEWAPLL